jgi:hypothetical protein
MKKIGFGFCVVASVILVVSMISCTQTPDPSISNSIESSENLPSSKYAADISGKVTIVDKISFVDSKSGNRYTWDGDGGLYKYWVIDLSVKNMYNNPIKSFYLYSDPLPKGIGYTDVWSLVSSNNKSIDILFNNYSGSFQGEGNFIPNNLSIKNGEMGKFILIFGVMSSSVSDTRIVYRGEEPYSYGKITGGDKVAAYDWDLKKAIATAPTPSTNKELYRLPTGNLELQTLGQWNGTGNKDISFSINKSPWVINYDFTTTSNIMSEITVTVCVKSEWEKRQSYSLGDIMSGLWIWADLGHQKYILVPQQGEYIINIISTGVNWSIKAGAE